MIRENTYECEKERDKEREREAMDGRRMYERKSQNERESVCGSR